VGLISGLPEVKLAAAAGIQIRADGRLVAGSEGLPFHYPAGGEVRVRPGIGGLEATEGAGGALAKARERIAFSPAGGELVVFGVGGHWDGVEDRSYRGEIEVRRGGGGGLTVINVVDVESYLRGVVPSEMSASYPPEALKAQAVAARTQALVKAGRHRAEGYDLCNGQHCQVYGGATSERQESDEAVAGTRGEILTYRGRPANTLYSAVCGGHTEKASVIWRVRDEPYLRAQPDFDVEQTNRFHFPLSEEEMRAYLREAPPANCYQPRYCALEKFRWWKVIRREELEESVKAAATDPGTIRKVKIVQRGISGAVTRLEIWTSGRKLVLRDSQLIRRAFGGLRSAAFALDSYEGPDGLPVVFVVWGAGWGHGVGMCQMGAVGLAEKGRDYRAILGKYYPGCELREAWR
jgi:SpoIID/LytB domain protein